MKKNLFKFLFAFVLCVATLFGYTKVSALSDTAYFKESTVLENRNNIVLSYKDVNRRTDVELGSTYKKALLDDKLIYAFCFNHEKDAPPTADKSNILKKRDLKACEQPKIYNFAYVLENGLGGNWSLGGDFTEHEKYYITQLAIWFVQGSACGGVDISLVETPYCANCNKVGRKGQIFQAAKTLYNNAMAQKAPANGSLAVEPKSSVMEPTADKKFYRSTDYKVSGSGFTTYTVKVADAPGVKIVNSATGAEYDSGVSLNAGTKFYIKVPKENVAAGNKINAKITITSGTVHKNIAIFEPVNTARAYQNIGVEYGETTPLSVSATATVDSKGSLVIRKREVDEKGEIRDLKDVTITVTSVKDSNSKWTWNTKDENPKTIANIPTGQYRIEEISAPAGFIKAETRTVTVKPLEVTTVELDNYKTVKVPVSKQDITTGAELPGATIQLQTTLGEVVEEWVSKTTPHYIEYDFSAHPEFKEYCLVETIAPKGYQKKTNKVCFKLNDKFGVDEPVVMTNEPETGVKISKVDAANGKELPGAKLIIKRKDTGEEVASWISTTKPHYVQLEPGKYILVEVTAPKGYGLSEEFAEFEVTKDGVKQTVVMKNSKIPDTADIPVVYIAVGLCLAILVAGFSMFKLSKQEQA